MEMIRTAPRTAYATNPRGTTVTRSGVARVPLTSRALSCTLAFLPAFEEIPVVVLTCISEQNLDQLVSISYLSEDTCDFTVWNETFADVDDVVWVQWIAIAATGDQQDHGCGGDCYRLVVLADLPELFWEFDNGDSVVTGVSDITGNGHGADVGTGTFNSHGEEPFETEGLIASATGLDFASATSADLLPNLDEITLVCWGFASDTTNAIIDDALLELCARDPDLFLRPVAHIHFESTAGNIGTLSAVLLDGYTAFASVSVPNITQPVNSRMVLRWDGTTLELILDEDVIGSTVPGSPWALNGSLFLGAGASLRFVGQNVGDTGLVEADEIHFHQRALTDAELAEQWSARLTRCAPPTCNDSWSYESTHESARCPSTPDTEIVFNARRCSLDSDGIFIWNLVCAGLAYLSVHVEGDTLSATVPNAQTISTNVAEIFDTGTFVDTNWHIVRAYISDDGGLNRTLHLEVDGAEVSTYPWTEGTVVGVDDMSVYRAFELGAAGFTAADFYNSGVKTTGIEAQGSILNEVP